MPRKPNYGFDKRRKEQDRKARKDAKAEEKRLRRDERPVEGAGEPAAPGETTGEAPPRPPSVDAP